MNKQEIMFYAMHCEAALLKQTLDPIRFFLLTSAANHASSDFSKIIDLWQQMNRCDRAADASVLELEVRRQGQIGPVAVGPITSVNLKDRATGATIDVFNRPLMGARHILRSQVSYGPSLVTSVTR